MAGIKVYNLRHLHEKKIFKQYCCLSYMPHPNHNVEFLKIPIVEFKNCRKPIHFK